MENTLNPLQFTIYPSLEALSCFGFISEGVDDMKYSVDRHVFISSLVWLVSQHEGILFSWIIKSIKVTSMLEGLDIVGFGYKVGVHGGGCLSVLPCWSVC